LPRNLHANDSGEGEFNERERLAYTRFQSFVEIFFSCRKLRKSSSQSAGIAVFVTSCWERTLQLPDNLSEKYDFQRNGDAQVGFIS
jgi:hypothetical protein